MIDEVTEFVWDLLVGGITTFIVLAVIAFVAGL